MPLDSNALRHRKFDDVRQAYDERDTMFYALSVGFGAEPTQAETLAFVYEKDLRAMPTMGAVLCHPGPWLRDPQLGVTVSKVVHGEQRMTFHEPLPPVGELYSRSQVIGVQDKGAGKGALIHLQKVLHDARTDRPILTIVHTSFCRADGGFDDSFGVAPSPHALPARPPDHQVDVAIRPDMALLYRLNADRNPLHIDPEAAQRAGFPKPILHGLCTYGIAARALIQALLGSRPELLRAFDARFAAVVYPGETLRIAFWRDGETVSFNARVQARDATVLDNGRALIRSG